MTDKLTEALNRLGNDITVGSQVIAEALNSLTYAIYHLELLDASAPTEAEELSRLLEKADLNGLIERMGKEQ